MDPVVLLLLVGMGGVVASVVSMRRTAGDGGRGPRLADPRSLLIGGALILAAVVVAYLLMMGAMS